MKKTFLTAAAVVAVAGSASAATISYSYAYDLMPGHEQGTAIYADDLHSDNGLNTGAFDSTGDLNDLVIYNGSNPVTDDGGANSMVGWSTVGGADTPATITVDLGGLYDLNFIDLTTFAFPSYDLGNPVGVTVSTSVDNVTYGAGTLHTLSGSVASGPDANQITRTDTSIQFIQLSFDGSTTTGNKWGLTELAIDGTAAVPEPSSTALLGLGGLALILRRRK